MNFYDCKTYIEDLHIAIGATTGIEKLENKSILVTGATGTIGSFLIDTLLEYNSIKKAGIKVYAAVRNREKLQDRLDRYGSESMESIYYDMNLPISFDMSADYIIHLSGNAHPAAFCNFPVDTMVGNINSTYYLLEYGRKHYTKRFVYVSSGEVYGQGNENNDVFKESYAGYVDNMSPRSCYPLSKRAAENLCASYFSQHGLETIVVRPCHTYGPTMTENDNRATVQFFRNVLNDEDIVMKSAGSQLRSYAYIADSISALLTVMINGNPGEAYNLANHNSRLTIAQFAKEVAKANNKQVVFRNPNDIEISQQSPISKQVLDSSKIESLGWEGKYTPELGIRHMMEILQNRC